MKSTPRQLAVRLIAAEMVLRKISIDDATSIVTRSYPQIADYVSDLYDTKTIQTGDKFRRDITTLAAPGI